MGFAVVSAVFRVTVSSFAPETTETQNGDGVGRVVDRGPIEE
jgi:hypothetical protein